MISRATMNLKPVVIELDFGPSSKRPFWIRSGCVCAVHSLMSALGQKQTYASQKAMSALPPIATAKADFSKGPCPLYPRKRTFKSAVQWEQPVDLCLLNIRLHLSPTAFGRTRTSSSNNGGADVDPLGPYSRRAVRRNISVRSAS